jgi:hypothetical protein
LFTFNRKRTGPCPTDQSETAGVQSRRKAATTCSFEVTMDEQMASGPLRCMFGPKEIWNPIATWTAVRQAKAKTNAASVDRTQYLQNAITCGT